MTIDQLMGRISVGNHTIRFTRHETAILTLLVSKEEVTSNDFQDAIWGNTRHSKTLGVQMHNVRHKIMEYGVHIIFDSKNKCYYMTGKEKVKL